MESLGVCSAFDDRGVQLRKCPSVDTIQYDFSECPDLAQTVTVVCAAKGIKGSFSGLESLRIKETDRIAALQNELKKFGAQLIERTDHVWELIPTESFSSVKDLEIATYDDHRMAMAFAPLAFKTDLIIKNPEVVDKSYPGFWKDLQKAGIKMETI